MKIPWNRILTPFLDQFEEAAQQYRPPTQALTKYLTASILRTGCMRFSKTKSNDF